MDVSSSRAMSITRKTTFSGILTSDIQDGCSDNYYTYWCDGSAGRIIKIRNTDHTIVYDDYFDLPKRDTASFYQGIHSIDTQNEKLYWNYVTIYGGWYIVHHSMSDNESMIINYVYEVWGAGISAEKDQNMVRIYGGFLFQDRSFNPSWGPLFKRDLITFVKLGETDQNYLQNILGVKDYLFILMHYNIGGFPTSLKCIRLSNMGTVKSISTSSYITSGTSCVSALNIYANKIIIVKWVASLQRNRVTGFTANEYLSLVYNEIPLKLGRR